MTTVHNSLIFISHASADKEAVALTDFLMHLFKLDTSDIVCTSSPGNGLCNGAQSYPEIERQIRNSAVVIFLLSRAYCESDDCKMEMAWGHSHSGRFIIHLESVRSSNKPKLLDSLSMNNWDRIGIAALAEHVKDKLNKTYSLLDWEREIEKLDFTGYQTQKENSDSASVQENSLGGSIIMGNAENNAAPIMLGNSAGGNIILEDNSNHYHAAQQQPQDDENTKRKAKLEEQGRLPLEDRTWYQLTATKKAEMNFLRNEISCGIRCAYVSAPFWSSEYDTECKAYVVRTFEQGYIQQTIGHHKLDPTYADNIWPYYFLIVSNRDKTLLEMHPHAVMCFRGSYREGMRWAEQLYNDVESKLL